MRELQHPGVRPVGRWVDPDFGGQGQRPWRAMDEPLRVGCMGRVEHGLLRSEYRLGMPGVIRGVLAAARDCRETIKPRSNSRPRKKPRETGGLLLGAFVKLWW